MSTRSTFAVGDWVSIFRSGSRPSGGRYQFEDDQETPDTQTVCFDFEGKRSLTWEGLSCNKHRGGFVTFYGTEGTLEMEGIGSHTIFDANDKVVDKAGSASQGDIEHIVNFLTAIRTDKPDHPSGGSTTPGNARCRERTGQGKQVHHVVVEMVAVYGESYAT